MPFRFLPKARYACFSRQTGSVHAFPANCIQLLHSALLPFSLLHAMAQFYIVTKYCNGMEWCATVHPMAMDSETSSQRQHSHLMTIPCTPLLTRPLLYGCDSCHFSIWFDFISFRLLINSGYKHPEYVGAEPVEENGPPNHLICQRHSRSWKLRIPGCENSMKLLETVLFVRWSTVKTPPSYQKYKFQSVNRLFACKYNLRAAVFVLLSAFLYIFLETMIYFRMRCVLFIFLVNLLIIKFTKKKNH